MRADQMIFQLGHNFLRKPMNVVSERTIAELQIVKSDEVFNVFNREWHANGDADGADGQKFDHALDANRPQWPDAFHRREAHHFRAMKEQLTRTAAARVHGKVCDRLAEQLVDGFARGVVGDIKRVNENNLADVARGGGSGVAG